MGQQSFTWNHVSKGPNITLSNSNLTANKKQIEADYEAVVGSIAFSSGRYYWEIKVDKFVEQDDIIIGVVNKSVDIRTRLFETGKFYGWICTGGRKISPAVPGGHLNPKEYGGQDNCAKIGDTLGCIFEFKNNVGYMSFLRNGNPLGICFNNIPSGSYLPVAYLYYGEV